MRLSTLCEWFWLARIVSVIPGVGSSAFGGVVIRIDIDIARTASKGAAAASATSCLSLRTLGDLASNRVVALHLDRLSGLVIADIVTILLHGCLVLLAALYLQPYC